jgi:hypothetical protein
MHNDDIERADERDDDKRVAVNAADDTGMVAQHELLVEAELGDQESSGRAESGVE